MPGVTEQLPRGKTELREEFRITTGEYVAALEVAQGNPLCLVGLGNGRILGLNVMSGRQLFSIAAHPNGVLGVSAAPDGRHFVSCGQEGSAKLWSAEGALLRELPSGGSNWVEHVAWAPSRGMIATAAGRKVRVWSADGEPIVETHALESTVTALAWRQDGTGLAATCYGGVHLLPFTPGAKPRHLAWKGSLISLAWSPNSKIIACGSQDCTVHFWRLQSGKDSEMQGYPFKPKALAWDRESKLLATSGDATVTVWDFHGKGPEGSQPIQLKAHHGACSCLAFAHSKCVLATGSQDTSVLVWEPRRGNQPTRFGFLHDEITAVRWHADDHTLIAGDASGTVAAWNVT
jgi:WD40 repeat protein